MILPLLAIAWLSGFAAVGVWGAPIWVAATWFVAATPAAWVLRGQGAVAILLVAAALAVVGAWRFEVRGPNQPLPDLARDRGEAVVIEGRVDSEPDQGLTTVRYHVRAERVRLSGGGAGANEWRETSGRALITVGQTTTLDYGAPVRLAGTLEAPPVLEAFNYRAFPRPPGRRRHHELPARGAAG